jgi:hypothetical protein
MDKSWQYARLGEKDDAWLGYGYRTTWSIKGQHQIKLPEKDGEWIESSDPIITIAPPLDRLELELDADRFLFEDFGVRSATLEVKYQVFGEEVTKRLAVMRVTDAESVSRSVLFHDPDKEILYRVNWYFAGGKPVKGGWQTLDETYLVLVPPER